jgi:quercetin dioxygenase-like cupin family protein
VIDTVIAEIEAGMRRNGTEPPEPNRRRLKEEDEGAGWDSDRDRSRRRGGRACPQPLGGDITFIVRGELSDGELAALEAVAPVGDGPRLHFHGREHETVYILEGEFRWKLGGGLSVTGPSAFVFMPRGLPHTWQNIGDNVGRMLITFSPAGIEGFFDSLADLTEFDLEAFRSAAAQQGMEVVGPALAESDPL